jgi:hypothetical protein
MWVRLLPEVTSFYLLDFHGLSVDKICYRCLIHGQLGLIERPEPTNHLDVIAHCEYIKIELVLINHWTDLLN